MLLAHYMYLNPYRLDRFTHAPEQRHYQLA